MGIWPSDATGVGQCRAHTPGMAEPRQIIPPRWPRQPRDGALVGQRTKRMQMRWQAEGGRVTCDRVTVQSAW